MIRRENRRISKKIVELSLRCSHLCSFVKDNRRCYAGIERLDEIAHWYGNPRIGGMLDFRRQARTFGAYKDGGGTGKRLSQEVGVSRR